MACGICAELQPGSVAASLAVLSQLHRSVCRRQSLSSWEAWHVAYAQSLIEESQALRASEASAESPAVRAAQQAAAAASERAAAAEASLQVQTEIATAAAARAAAAEEALQQQTAATAAESARAAAAEDALQKQETVEVPNMPIPRWVLAQKSMTMGPRSELVLC
eukprot:scaffold189696_cov15-Tisochrysis_lutea.AAC.1